MVHCKFDVCGILAVLITYSSLIYSDYCMIVYVLHPTIVEKSLWGTIHVVLYNTVIFILVYAHIKAVRSDPGRLPLPEVAVDFSETRRTSRKRKGKSVDEWTTCGRCEMFRPPRAHHCTTCRRCIKKMDHHCPWIYNCVGERNVKCFLLYLFYVMVFSIYTVLLTAALFWRYTDEYTLEQIHERKIHVIVLLVMGLFFTLFSCWMMYDQLYCVFHDVTSIELINPDFDREAHPPKSKMAYLTDVCGGGSKLKWFLPCATSMVTFDDGECGQSTLYV